MPSVTWTSADFSCFFFLHLQNKYRSISMWFIFVKKLVQSFDFFILLLFVALMHAIPIIRVCIEEFLKIVFCFGFWRVFSAFKNCSVGSASENFWIIISEKYFYGALITKSIPEFLFISCENIMEPSYTCSILTFRP